MRFVGHGLLIAGLISFTSFGAEGKPRRTKAPTSPAAAQAALEQASAGSSAQQLCHLLLGNNGADTMSAESPLSRKLWSSFRLSEYFQPGGLAYENPLIAMNAAQRLIAMIRSMPIRYEVDPLAPSQKVAVYDFFSAGTPLTDNRMVVDKFRVIEMVVNRIRDQAQSQFGPGSKTILLKGTPGTGKSELLEVIKAGFLKFSARPEFQITTFKWKDLAQIPSLRKILPEDSDHFLSAMGHSPVQLLPEPLRKAYMERVAPLVKKMTGLPPRIFGTLDPQNVYIRDEIVRHAANEKGRPLSELEVLEALDRFVEVVPLSEQMLEKKAYLIPRQGNPVDYRSLFWINNPGVQYELGQQHPFAYHIGGALPSAHGGLVLWDELFKNKADLLEKLLTFFQSRKLTEGSISGLYVDVVMIVADNNKNIEAHQKEDEQSAVLSRMSPVNMNWPTKPGSIAGAVAYEGRETLISTPIEEELKTKFPEGFRLIEHPEMFDQLFPLHAGSGARTGMPDGRFSLSFTHPTEEGGHIHVSPYTLALLSGFVALSRSYFDPARAQQIGLNLPILNDPIFRDPAVRLRYLMGKEQLSSATIADFEKISEALGEGTEGIEHRFLTDLLPIARSEAAKTRNGCITPSLIRRVIETKFLQGLSSSSEEIKDWANLLGLAERFIVYPGIIGDIQRGLTGSRNESVVRDIYRQILHELQTLATDPLATEYTMQGNTLDIEKKRLARVREIFRALTGRNLTIEEVAMFQMQAFVDFDSDSVEMNEDLKSAILQYQQEGISAGLNATVGNLERIVAIGAGSAHSDDSTSDAVTALAGNLIKNHGYCRVCAQDGFKLVQRYQRLDKSTAGK